MIELNKESIVYVLCPAYIKTGGTELLHQLVYILNNNNINAEIAYFNVEEDLKYTPDDFKNYIDKYILMPDIVDSDNNVVIIPEIKVEFIKQFKNAKTAIWWMSVDNYQENYNFFKRKKVYGFKPAIRKYIKNILNGTGESIIYKADYHLCQSYYSIDFLTKKGIKNYEYLSDFINDSFLNSKYSISKKEDIVLYNPKKGAKFTEKIRNATPELNWVPIQNMTTNQVKELLLKSKVYIDFGNHPGKDRFPRETAICGCCVITGMNGSAKFEKDVPIPKKYKFADSDKNINDIISTIKNCLSNYDKEIDNFIEYREYIKNEKKNFIKDVKHIFVIKK